MPGVYYEVVEIIQDVSLWAQDQLNFVELLAAVFAMLGLTDRLLGETILQVGR